MAYRTFEAVVYLLAGLGHLYSLAEALGCRPCYGRNTADIQMKSNLAMPAAIETNKCKKPGSCQNGTVVFSLKVDVSDQVHLNGTYQNYLDALSVIGCLVYAVEMGSKGVQPRLLNVSGVISVCVNFTDFVRVVRNHTTTLDGDHKGNILHFVHPSVIKWVTVITCVVSLLLAL